MITMLHTILSAAVKTEAANVRLAVLVTMVHTMQFAACKAPAVTVVADDNYELEHFLFLLQSNTY